jgi:hypothetical protein
MGRFSDYIFQDEIKHKLYIYIYRSRVVSLGIFSEANDGTMCPGVDSASKNEYQENSWE